MTFDEMLAELFAKTLMEGEIKKCIVLDKELEDADLHNVLSERGNNISECIAALVMSDPIAQRKVDELAASMNKIIVERRYLWYQAMAVVLFLLDFGLKNSPNAARKRAENGGEQTS